MRETITTEGTVQDFRAVLAIIILLFVPKPSHLSNLCRKLLGFLTICLLFSTSCGRVVTTKYWRYQYRYVSNRDDYSIIFFVTEWRIYSDTLLKLCMNLTCPLCFPKFAVTFLAAFRPLAVFDHRSNTYGKFLIFVSYLL